MDHDDDRSINRIVRALGYNPGHVCAARLDGSAIEVDVIDFVDDDWPLITHRHAVPAAPLGGVSQQARERPDEATVDVTGNRFS